MINISNLTIIDAILSINPVAEVSYHGGGLLADLDACELLWNDNTTPISKEDIRAKMVERQAQYDAEDYARKRLAEFPSVRELVVALYDTDDKAAIEAKRAEVKAKYPKP